MPSPLEEIGCACMPREALPLLAGLRTEPGVHAALTEHHAWLRWEVGSERVLRTVLPIHAAVLYAFREGAWHRLGQTLPAFDFPAELEYRPLSHVLFPAPVQPIAAPGVALQPVRLSLRRDDRPRRTAALLCPPSVLLAWSDTVPNARLASLQGIHASDRVLVMGDLLPSLAESVRFWGRDVLIPLGHAPDPALPESALKQVVGLSEEELLLWQPDHAEALQRGNLSPLSRAGLRLIASRGAP